MHTHTHTHTHAHTHTHMRARAHTQPAVHTERMKNVIMDNIALQQGKIGQRIHDQTQIYGTVKAKAGTCRL